jgi:hypothetical protein
VHTVVLLIRSRPYSNRAWEDVPPAWVVTPAEFALQPRFPRMRSTISIYPCGSSGSEDDCPPTRFSFTLFLLYLVRRVWRVRFRILSLAFAALAIALVWKWLKGWLWAGGSTALECVYEDM